MSWLSRKSKKPLVFSRLLLPDPLTITRTWDGFLTLCSMPCLCGLERSLAHETKRSVIDGDQSGRTSAPIIPHRVQTIR
jgi:hypothetical protein